MIIGNGTPHSADIPSRLDIDFVPQAKRKLALVKFHNMFYMGMTLAFWIAVGGDRRWHASKPSPNS